MERARDTGTVSISGKVTLVIETGKDIQAGFLMYVPVYAKGMPLDGVENRRAALEGYVFSPFRMDDLMRGTFPEPTRKIDFQIFDGADISPSALMSDRHHAHSAPDKNHGAMFSSRKTLDLYGHQWTLALESTSPFEATVAKWMSWGLLAAGLFISLLAFLFVRSQTNAHERAFALAHEMTLALRQSEEKYRTLTDSQPVGVSIIGQNMEVLAVNARQREWFPKADCDQHPLCYTAFCLPPRTEPCEDCPVIKAYQDGQVHTMEREVETQQGVRFYKSSATPLTDAEGKVISVHGMLEDITEHKQAEQDRIARWRAEETSRAKSAFVANMSHEIRTPLNAILGFAQILDRDPLLTHRQTEHVRDIIRSGMHLLNLINDILDMSKIEAGQTPLNETTFCLHHLLDELELMFRSRAGTKGLQLLLDRDESTPRYVTADEGKLRQVLINLIENAIKFTETGGVVARVRAEAVEGKTVAGKEALRLVAEVEDTGPGIPDEDMVRIFTAFQQAEAGVKAGGTGLGLAISRRFVEIMGGELIVTSQVDKGSCFRFEVLLASAEDVLDREKPALRRVVGLEPGTGPFRILVVDDMPENRFLLREILRPVGFEVAEASNGVEAIEVFGRWSPHAVIMDMRMPVMDGYETTRQLKATEAGRATPVIAVTASAFQDEEALALQKGVVAYLRKPFQRQELLEAIGECLSLRYIFADEADKFQCHSDSTPLKPGSLAALPKELMRAMRQAVAEGDMACLRDLIAQVEKVDSNVTRGLRDLSDRYDYEKLSEILGRECG